MSGDDIVREIRENYDREALIEANVAADPLEQFGRWMEDAIAAQIPEPNAMTLATVDGAGKPSARIVLLRGFGADGFSFYTNYKSRKGAEMARNPNVALVFFWSTLHRQVRVEGSIAKMSDVESDAYFSSRPRGHRLGAWASRQSAPLLNRAALEEEFAAVDVRFDGAEVPRPPHWGGYRVTPHAIEFWQGRPNRTHDRLRFERVDGAWTMLRLAP